MALAYALRLRDPDSTRFSRIVDITLDNSYPSPGGWAITPANLGFGTGGVIESMLIQNPVLDGYFIQWDQVNSKLKAFQCAGAGAPGTELGNGVSVLNNKVVRALVYAAGSQT